MELRQPPRPPEPTPRLRLVHALLAANLFLLAALALTVWLRPGDGRTSPEQRQRQRDVAAKLQAAGVLDEAAVRWARYLEISDQPAETRARIAYSLGETLLEAGRYEQALGWFYEAESLDSGALREELSARIVRCLELLGRHHAAEAAMGSRVSLVPPAGGRDESDPVVARIGDDEIRRSRLEQALDELPPEVAREFSQPERREEVLRRYVAEELLWRKALKLELDDDPQVRRRHAALLKQLAVGALVERELLAKIEIDETDLRTWFEANKERYAGEDPSKARGFDELRPLVERDYRLVKTQAAYQRLLDSELSAAGVELFPERLIDGS